MLIMMVQLQLLLRVLLFIVVVGPTYGSINNTNGKDETVTTNSNTKKRYTIHDMVCTYIEQPLNHYDLPIGRSGYYKQRYCYYNEFITKTHNKNNNNESHDNNTQLPPVLLYVGNESPLEQYINHTGFMWELGEEIQAQIIFIEHRYEGLSKPDPSTPNCLAYSSSIQALADYANFIERVLFLNNSTDDTELAKRGIRPVIAFGGSYGGMLATWIRTLYPHLITGSVAASAPVVAYPLQVPTKIDTSFRIISHGIQQPYPPTKNNNQHSTSVVSTPKQDSNNNDEITNYCGDNLLATFPLVKLLGTIDTGRKLLQETFRLCPTTSSNLLRTKSDVQQLVSFIKRPWFLLAEGSYPYPSSYIAFLVTLNDTITLPAWPLQAACWNVSNLYSDYGIRFSGNRSDVSYDIHFQFSNDDTKSDISSETTTATIHIDWDNATTSPEDLTKLVESSTIQDLLSSVRDAINVWFNVSQDVPCHNLSSTGPGTNTNSNVGGISNGLLDFYHRDYHHYYDHNDIDTSENINTQPVQLDIDTLLEEKSGTIVLSESRQLRSADTTTVDTKDKHNITAKCERRIQNYGSWAPLCCNEPMNLIITDAAGMGYDTFWPPSYPRGVSNYHDILQIEQKKNQSLSNGGFCNDPHGYYGLPQSITFDTIRATWYDIVYGSGVSTRDHRIYSNIIFSNGLLDPWSAGGVYLENEDPTIESIQSIIGKNNSLTQVIIPGLYVQNISTTRSVVTIIMEYGGHHTDLMYSSPDNDPPSITQARIIEKHYIQSWIDEFWSKN